jgi:hypothetical protein
VELLSILAVIWVVKVLFTDVAYAARGETPPRVKLKMAQLQKAGGKNAPPRRYGAGDYFRDLWHDAMEDAREHREKKRADAKAAAADDSSNGGGEAVTDPAQAPGPSPVQAPPAVPTMPAPPGVGAPQQPGAADGARPRLVDVTPTDWPGWGPRRERPPMPEVPRANLDLFDQYLLGLVRLGDDSWSEQMRAKSWDELRAYWAHIASLTPEELCAELNAELAKARARVAARGGAPNQNASASQAGDGGQQTPLADVLPIRPVPKEGNTVSTPTTSAPAPEATGLTSAIAYASQMAATFGNNAASTEQWIASLQGQGGVTGPAIAAAHQAVEKQQECAAAWQACAAALGGHTQVKEAYQANPGAGNREFVTND